MNFPIEVGNHPLASIIFPFTALLNIHPYMMVSAVDPVAHTVGTLHGLFHFTGVIHLQLVNDKSSLPFPH
jgi:hypothetical protein